MSTIRQTSLLKSKKKINNSRTKKDNLGVRFKDLTTTAKINPSYDGDNADDKYECSEIKTKTDLKQIEETPEIKRFLDICKEKFPELFEDTAGITMSESPAQQTKQQQKYPFTLDTAKSYLHTIEPDLLGRIIGRTATNEDIQKAYILIRDAKQRKIKNIEQKNNTFGNSDLNSFVLIIKKKPDQLDTINYNIISELYSLTGNKEYYKTQISNDNQGKDNFAINILPKIKENAEIAEFKPIYDYFRTHDNINKFINDNFVNLSLDAMLNKLDIFANFKHFAYSRKVFNFTTFYYTADNIYNLFKHLNGRQELSDELIYYLLIQLDNTTKQSADIKELNITDTTFIIAKIMLKIVFINRRDKKNNEPIFTQINNIINNNSKSPFEELCQLCSSQELYKADKYIYINYLLPIFIGLYLIKTLDIKDNNIILKFSIIIHKYIPNEYIDKFEYYYEQYLTEINTYSDQYSKLSLQNMLKDLNYSDDTKVCFTNLLSKSNSKVIFINISN